MVKQPTVISTFAGCGGSSLGYKLAGYKELLAVEWDDNAVATFKLNFPDVPVFHGDIAQLSGDECMKLAGIAVGELDVFDGSPPCQGFSMAGKRKFNDPRNSLFKEYARLLNDIQPKVFVMENVTGMIKGVMKQAYLQIVKILRDCGYNVKGQVLNAMYYNVPQRRERVILIGVRKDLGIEPSHPKPQAKPISAREAFKGLPRQESPPVSKFLQNILPKMKQGENAGKYLNGDSFQTVRIFYDKPCSTLSRIKGGVGVSSVIHPEEDRVLSCDEMKRIGSFPDNFIFSGNWHDVKACIGNSVPPNLMKAVAEHIRDNLLI